MNLFFLYLNDEHSIVQQYFVYDLGAFIADVGGYLVTYLRLMITYNLHAFSKSQGLCLGASLLTFYDLIVKAIIKISGKITQMKMSKKQS